MKVHQQAPHGPGTLCGQAWPTPPAIGSPEMMEICTMCSVISSGIAQSKLDTQFEAALNCLREIASDDYSSEAAVAADQFLTSIGRREK